MSAKLVSASEQRRITERLCKPGAAASPHHSTKLQLSSSPNKPLWLQHILKTHGVYHAGGPGGPTPRENRRPQSAIGTSRNADQPWGGISPDRARTGGLRADLRSM